MAQLGELLVRLGYPDTGTRQLCRCKRHTLGSKLKAWLMVLAIWKHLICLFALNVATVAPSDNSMYLSHVALLALQTDDQA